MRRTLQSIFVTGALLVSVGGVAAASAPSAAPPAIAALSPAAYSAPSRILSGDLRGIAEVVDSSNHVHIASTGRGGLWYSTNRTGSWTARRILVSLTNKSYVDPTIALDANDRVFIAVTRSSCDDCTPGGSDGIFYVTDKERTRGTFPSSPTRIAGATTDQASLKVRGGHLYFVYISDCCHPGPLPPVWFKTNASGAWTKVKIATHGWLPSLRLTSTGRARVVFERPSAIGYAAAATATGSFTVSSIPGTGGSDLSPLLALDSSDRPHVAWVHAGSTTATARYAWRASSGWTSPATATSVSGFGAPLGFDLDTSGRPNIAIAGSNLKVARLSGGTWLTSTVATSVSVNALVLRRAFSGHVDLAWTEFDNGLWVSHN